MLVYHYTMFPVVPLSPAGFLDWFQIPTIPIHVFLSYTFVFLFLVSFFRYRRAVAMVSNFPGLRLLTSPMSTLGLVLPPLPMPLYTYPGFSFPWTLKHAGLFKKFGCDTVSVCGWDGRAILYTCDVPFLTRMASNVGSSVFPKPIEEYGVLSYFGDNLVIAEHSNWRRQRRVTAPAFSSKVFRRLWIDMSDIVHNMLREDHWSERTDQYSASSQGYFTPAGEYVPAKGEVYFPHVVDITLRMSLAAIARTGFGIDFEWRSDESFTLTCAEFGHTFGSSIIQTFIGVIHPFLALFTPHTLHARLRRLLTLSSSPEADHTNHKQCKRMYYASCALRKLHSIATSLVEGPVKSSPEMRLQEALHLVAKESTLKLALSSLPSWIQRFLPFLRIRRMNLAFDCLQSQLRLMVAQRRREIVTTIEGSFSDSSSDRTSSNTSHGSGSGPAYSGFGTDFDPKAEDFDLLSNLVRSAMQTERLGGKSLTDDEIIGNAYIYLLAGHETTAHSLAWTLALLAAYPEQQEKAYQEIMENDPNEETTVRDYPKFRFLLACYHETLRLFPPVQQIPKVAAEDTQILIERSNDLEMGGSEMPSRDEAKYPEIPEINLASSSNTSLQSTPSRIFGNHRRHKLPPLAIPARLQPSAGLDDNFGTPSMPATPSVSPVKDSEYFQSRTPTSTQTESFGPPPFVQLNTVKQAIATEPLCPTPEHVSLVIKKGTVIFISPPAVHYNPKYWEDPETFNPGRFLKPHNKSAFIPFGVGLRACLGRKFSEVESVCILVHLLRHYSVHLPLQPGESIEEARRKFSKASVRITLTPEKVPLIFRKRMQQ